MLLEFRQNKLMLLSLLCTSTYMYNCNIYKKPKIKTKQVIYLLALLFLNTLLVEK